MTHYFRAPVDIGLNGAGLRLAVCLSGHGFGHAARTCVVLTAFIRLIPSCRILIISDVPQWFLEERITAGEKGINWTVHPIRLDVGAIQQTSVSVDHDKTIEALNDLWFNRHDSILAECTLILRSFNPHCCYFDIPAIAPRICLDLGLPAYASSNFGWDWIHSHLVPCDSRYERFAQLSADAYNLPSVRMLFALPPSCGWESWKSSPIVYTPWITATASSPSVRSESEIRSLIGLPESSASCPKVLFFSFGGHAFPIHQYISSWEIPSDFVLLLLNPQPYASGAKPRSGSLLEIGRDELSLSGLDPLDLQRVSDVLLIKPGYGILSELLCANTSPSSSSSSHADKIKSSKQNVKPILFVVRPRFPEDWVLSDCLRERTVCEELQADQLLTCDIFDAARRVLNTQRDLKIQHHDGQSEAATNAELAGEVMDEKARASWSCHGAEFIVSKIVDDLQSIAAATKLSNANNSEAQSGQRL